MAQATARQRVTSARIRPSDGTWTADARTETSAVSVPRAAVRARVDLRGAAVTADPVAAAPAVPPVHRSSTAGPGPVHRNLWEIPVISPASPLHTRDAWAYSAACVSARALRVVLSDPGRAVTAVADDGGGGCGGGASACTLRFGALRYIRVIPCMKVRSVRFARAPDIARHVGVGRGSADPRRRGITGRSSGQRPVHGEQRGVPPAHPGYGTQGSHGSRRVRRRKGTDTW